MTVDNVSCAYFDKVEKLCDFGRDNKETLLNLCGDFSIIERIVMIMQMLLHLYVHKA